MFQTAVLPAKAAFTSSFDVDADIVYLVSADDDAAVIYDKGSTERVNPVSLVKAVTAILVIENCSDLSAPVTASSTAIRRIEQFKGTNAGILVGEEMTVEQLLYCLLVYNANDAASVLAEYTAGSEEKFVDMMNEFANRLELKDTLFADPGGYSDGEQFSTARDIAVIFNYCMKNNTFERIISTFLYEIPGTNKYHQSRALKTTNGLINRHIADYYVAQVKGGKAAYDYNTKTNHVVSVASKDGYNYICVVLNAEDKDFDSDGATENMAFIATSQLYDWVFDNIKLRVVADPSTYVGEIKVKLSNKYDYVSLVPAKSVSALVPAGANAESVLIEPISDQIPESINAPIKAGDIIGKGAIKYAGETVAEVDLAAAFDVEASTIAVIGYHILNILKSTVFKIFILVLVIIFIPIGIMLFKNKKAPNKKRIVKNKK